LDLLLNRLSNKIQPTQQGNYYYHDMAQETNSKHYPKTTHNYAQTWCEYGIGIRKTHLLLKQSQKDLTSLVDKQIK